MLAPALCWTSVRTYCDILSVPCLLVCIKFFGDDFLHLFSKFLLYHHHHHHHHHHHLSRACLLGDHSPLTIHTRNRQHIMPTFVISFKADLENISILTPLESNAWKFDVESSSGRLTICFSISISLSLPLSLSMSLTMSLTISPYLYDSLCLSRFLTISLFTDLSFYLSLSFSLPVSLSFQSHLDYLPKVK
jgi:hypothetical protein